VAQPRGVKVKAAPEVLAQQVQHQQDVYLASLRQDGTLTGGCTAAHVSAHTIYWWREHDETFPIREREALEAFADMLEREIVRRGVHGTSKPIYHQGELVGHTTEYSDRLLELAAKASRPSKFRERLDVNTNTSIVIRVVSARVDPLSVV
jgi:hypothetical protein